MLVPCDCPQSRLRHLLQLAGTNHSDVAGLLDITPGRFSQLLKTGDFKASQLLTMRENIEGFSVEYYLEGRHPAEELHATTWRTVSKFFPLAPLLRAELSERVENGGPRGTVIKIEERVIRVMYEDDPEVVRADPLSSDSKRRHTALAG